jgi:hypothetical protein
MGWKDQVNKTFSQGNRPQFEFKRVEIKENKFTFYDSDSRERVEVSGGLEGIVFGYAYQLSAFDSKYGKNGGTYNSSFIFEWLQTNVAIFSPSGTRVFDGEYKDAKEFISNAADSPVKFRIAFFVRTSSETFAVYSNGIIGIDQIAEYGSKFSGHLVSLSPTVLDFKNPQISKKALKRFDKVKKLGNPPVFALLEICEQITPAIESQYDIETVATNFALWKEYSVKLKPIDDEVVAETTYEHEVRESVDAVDKGTDVYESPTDDILNSELGF